MGLAERRLARFGLCMVSEAIGVEATARRLVEMPRHRLPVATVEQDDLHHRMLSVEAGHGVDGTIPGMLPHHLGRSLPERPSGLRQRVLLGLGGGKITGVR